MTGPNINKTKTRHCAEVHIQSEYKCVVNFPMGEDPSAYYILHELSGEINSKTAIVIVLTGKKKILTRY